MAKHSQWSDFDTTDDYCSMDTEPCKIIVSHTGAYILLSLHHFSAAHGTGLSRSLKVFTVYPCLLQLLMPSPSTHAFSVYSCLHHLPMLSLSTHAFPVYPCLFMSIWICFFFSEESKRRGITVVIDSRDGSWSNLVTVLGCLKVSNVFVF